MRYQQVCNASLFTNVDRSQIYITSLTFFLDSQGSGANWWVLTNLEISLSTTAFHADSLSTTFATNVGLDATVVFGPRSYLFQGGFAASAQQLFFDRPFRYDPSQGNLLIDVFVFNGAGPFDPLEPAFWAYNTSTDEVSRVWAPDVNATNAIGADTIGLFSRIEFSGIPSLSASFYPSYSAVESNIVIISWPSQPSVFALQESYLTPPNATWHAATNQLLGSPVSGNRFIKIRAGSTTIPRAFYRLVWTNGVGPSSLSKGSDDLGRPTSSPR